MTGKTFVTEAEGGSTADRVLRRIRHDIITNRLGPGDRLRLERLREAYGASVSTLREILNRLVAEGFVVAEGNRGFGVAPISERDLRDICQMRLLLECHALRRSIEVGGLDWEAQVVSAHHKLRSVEDRLIGGDDSQVMTWVQYDWDFHHATVMACDMPVLSTTHSNIFDRFMRYHLYVLDFRGRPAAEEHARLRDLVVGRDAEGAVALLSAHVRAGMEHIIASGRIPA
ncbi:GntR family transcriptional regulator [Pseudooceanicola sp. CBS1P-1]|uniref:FCD domain-containing protein n=1 Tax=Pseudooceanicola albus TaxID=2692189 RepID=A0A6L7G572_9RHOB|nr:MULTISPECIES: GntR family transcriptional regulator [Pseudooceanicola]MBT9385319.1 GntR family transcriptional regulator [Pseudooceanicola endophyticus]MXN18822.1 FCD domain-containing protein [Pseudooceanicola albus]